MGDSVESSSSSDSFDSTEANTFSSLSQPSLPSESSTLSSCAYTPAVTEGPPSSVDVLEGDLSLTGPSGSSSISSHHDEDSLLLPFGYSIPCGIHRTDVQDQDTFAAAGFFQHFQTEVQPREPPIILPNPSPHQQAAQLSFTAASSRPCQESSDSSDAGTSHHESGLDYCNNDS
ncbi:hypothetical protein Aduo_011508 [Ancylostoma duodenale]